MMAIAMLRENFETSAMTMIEDRQPGPFRKTGEEYPKQDAPRAMVSSMTGSMRRTATGSINPLFEDAIIFCIADACDPTVEQMSAVAARIWTESAADRSVFDWNKLPTRSVERVTALLSARLALCGSPPIEETVSTKHVGDIAHLAGSPSRVFWT
jgi:hypothetical protein